jgi:hypothetical protein
VPGLLGQRPPGHTGVIDEPARRAVGGGEVHVVPATGDRGSELDGVGLAPPQFEAVADDEHPHEPRWAPRSGGAGVTGSR